MALQQSSVIGIIGAGAMGTGIAQVAATANHKTIIYDSNQDALAKAKSNIVSSLLKLVDKKKIEETTKDTILANLSFEISLSALTTADLIIEAIVENIAVKQALFLNLEKVVRPTCILASNTSSLSIASIASVCQASHRVIGIHFFNPPTLMPLVEIIPALQTEYSLIADVNNLIKSWGKETVVAKDLPGFIVNRIARPYYGEAIRIYEEGIADFATIDYAMQSYGGFKMGPFELMDFIGNDINYKVTETVWEQFFYEPRFKPSFTQKRLFEAKRFGKKTGQGYYSYAEGAIKPAPNTNELLVKQIYTRILCMLINEAVDALYLQVASAKDIDTSMQKGVNYPKGLLAWCDEIGANVVLANLEELYKTYQEDRYRPSVLLKRLAQQQKKIYE